MNRNLLIASLFLALALCVSCGKKKDDNTIIIHKTEKKAPTAVLKVGDGTQTTDVKWLGASYKVTVTRKADTSLKVVTDDNGQRYYDNRITVRVQRMDGTDVFNKEFTKKSFEPYITKDFAEKAALYNIVYIQVDGSQLTFVVSIGSPNQLLSDEYLRLNLNVNSQGNFTITKCPDQDETFDNDSDDEGV